MLILGATLDVDDETFDHWRDSVRHLARIRRVPLRAVGTVPLAIPAYIEFRGIELLLEIGLACTRPDLLNDPSRLFAFFRYGDALANTAPDLALSPDFVGLDTHKKKVLSDEFGCGMAFCIARRVLAASSFLDFETAETQGWLKTAAPRSKRPDYACWGSNHRVLDLLEAKGTQSGQKYCERRQIPSGCKQVAAVRARRGSSHVAGKRLVSGLALAAEGGKSVALVGDPEEAHAYNYDFEVEPDEAVVRSHYARAAAMIGDVPLLDAVGHFKRRSAGKPPTVKTRQHRHVHGTELVVRCERRRISLFLGMDSAVRTAILEHHYSDRPTREISFAGDEPPLEGPFAGEYSLELNDGVEVLVELST